MKSKARAQLEFQLCAHLEVIYQKNGLLEDVMPLALKLISAMGLDEVTNIPIPHQNHWDQSDMILIAYGDSLHHPDERALHTLHRFLTEQCNGSISGVHVLPFFPYSSDDGFSVTDFYQVRESVGEWEDIVSLASEYRVMSDLVINHASAESLWFKNFLAGKGDGSDFFYTCPHDADVSQVVRPRTTPLLNAVETVSGTEHVWCTFSADQVDLNFANPQVLLEFARIIRFYLDRGVNIFRLDAVAFLWKKAGSTCLNLPETHEIVRLLRTLIEFSCPDAMLITETNIPSRENLSYFGNANEAHCVYNFSLPPLLVYTLITGDCVYLRQWMMSMPPAQDGTAYFNFIASHDGIGLRPVEGLLNEDELALMLSTMQSFGGHVSWRALKDGQNKPYEINISLFDALQGTVAGADEWSVQRFICAHTIMFALEGIPGLYIQSLLGSRNDNQRVEMTGHNRSINRHHWEYSELVEALKSPESHHYQVFNALQLLIKIRIKQEAFHPNATQYTLQLGSSLFGFWRQSSNRIQSIFCISNISDQPAPLLLSDLNLISTSDWSDLITKKHYADLHETVVIQPYETLWIANC